MTTTPWHLDPEMAERYARGHLGGVLNASVEQHLVGCPSCRSLLAPQIDEARLDAVWAEVLESVEKPQPTLLERLLRRLGASGATARLVAATPSLRGGWFGGMFVLLALALVAAYVDPQGVALYLAIAPLLPMAGVAAAFGPLSDPAHEIVAATPYSSVRLLSIRTAFVVTTTLPPATVAGLLLPGTPLLAGAWLLPALTLTVGTVALSARVSPHLAATGLAVLWSAVALLGMAPRRDPLLAASAPVLVLCTAVLAATAAYLITHRRDVAEIVRRAA